MDKSFGLELSQPEPPGNGKGVLFVLVVQQPERAGLSWEFVSGKDPELRESAHRVSAAAVVRIPHIPVIS